MIQGESIEWAFSISAKINKHFENLKAIQSKYYRDATDESSGRYLHNNSVITLKSEPTARKNTLFTLYGTYML